MASRLSSPEFVGRAGERARMSAALDAAIAGRPRVVLVGGEAGIGKTRLVEETSVVARRRDVLVLTGGAVDVGEGALPFGPLVEALRGLLRTASPELLREVTGPSTAALGRLMPEFAVGVETPGSAIIRPEWIQARIFEGVLALCAGLSERWPLTVVLEDLHWSDRSTRDVVAFLARNLRSERILLVATFRSDELHRRHPLVPWLAELERNPIVERIDLPRFDAIEQRAQLTGILGRPAPESVVREIHARSDGNPFFAEELLAVSVPDHGDGGRVEPGALPTSVAGVLMARVAALSEPTQRLLGIAAVAGRRVAHRMLVEIAGQSEAAVEAALHEAISAQLLVAETTDAEPTYAFRHALAQEAVYDDLLPSVRRRIHARCAELLDARPPATGAAGARDLAQKAHHWAAARVQDRALAASVAAGDAARDAYAFAEAGRQYERALELWEVVRVEDRPSTIDEAELSIRAAWVLGFAGDLQRAVEFGRQAVQRADGAAEPARLAGLHTRLARLEWQNGDLDAAIANYEAARRLLATAGPGERAEALAGLATILMLAGRLREAVTIATDAIDEAIASGRRDIEGNAKNTKGCSLAFIGQCAEAIRLLEEAMTIAWESPEPNELGRVHSNLPSALEVCGDLDRAIAISLQGAEVAQQVGTWQTFGIFQECNAAGMLIKTGGWDQAAGILERTEPFLSPGVHRLNHHVYAALLYALRGDPAADAYVKASVTAAERMRDAQFTGPVYESLIAWELAHGRPDAAAAAAIEAVRRLVTLDDESWLFVILTEGIRAEADRASSARARRDDTATADAVARGQAHAGLMAERLATSPIAHLPDTEAVALWATAERTRLDGTPDPAAWAASRARWAALGRPYRAAYAAFREAEAALEARQPRATAEEPVRAAVAVLRELRAAPLLAEVEALARRARIPLESVDAAPESDLEAAPAEPVDEVAAALDRYGLTVREREILALVAAGHTNRRIADALFISESTAGVHVSNILGKLGVSSRVEAATIATRLGVVLPEVPA